MGSALVRRQPASEPAAAPLAAVANDGVLPTDVLVEVLLRLPANALCRLRAVCRAWRSLTCDPIFVKAHSSRHPLLACLHCSSGEIHFTDLIGNIVKRIHTVQVANLFDLNTHLDMVTLTDTEGRLCVINAATGAVSVLPANVAEHETLGCASSSSCKLGWVPSTGEYKVLRMHMYRSADRGDFVQICSIVTVDKGNETWRTIPSPSTLLQWDYSRSVVVLGGVAYFLLCHYNDDIEVDRIAAFDFATEEWRPVTRGPVSSLLADSEDSKVVYSEDYWDCFRLAVLNGCLVMVHHNSRGRPSLELWFLTTDIDEVQWTKRYSLAVPHAPWAWKYIGTDFHPVVVLDDGRTTVWVKRPTDLIAYDAKTCTWNYMDPIYDYAAIGVHQGSLLGEGLYVC
ncbi:hypothetical protein ACP70R_022672 [Stipagrostis hirtigluma subsp. patula]